MALVVVCPSCGDGKTVPDFFAGTNLRCRCGSSFPIPGLAKSDAAKTLPLLRQLEGHEARISAGGFSPDSRFIVSCSDGEQDTSSEDCPTIPGSDYTIRLWDVTSGKEFRRFVEHTDSITAVTFSPDGRFLLSGSRDKTVRLWDLGSGQAIRQFEGHTEGVTSVTFSRKGRYALSGSWDRTVRVWEVACDQPWDMTKGRQLRCLRIEGQSEARNGTSPQSVAWSPEGREVLAGCEDSLLRIWDVENGRLLRCLEGHTERVLSAVYIPDSQHALSGSYDGTMRLWDTTTGRELRRFWVAHPVFRVAVSHNGQLALCTCLTGPAGLWRIRDSQLLCQFERQRSGTNTPAFSPDGQHILISGTDDRTDFHLCLYRMPKLKP